MPQRSEVTRWEVEVPVSLCTVLGTVAHPVPFSAPGAVGVGRARLGSIRQARVRAKRFDSRVFSGTST